MKKILNYHFHLKEDTVIRLYLLWMAILFLAYIGCIAYVVLRFMHSDPVQPKDVVVVYGGLRIQRKVLPFFKNKVFVRR